MKKMYKILLLVMVIFLLVNGTSFGVTFTDLPENHWAYDNITSLVEKGVINGYADGTYQPDKEITRGEFIKLIMTANKGEAFFEPLKPYATRHWADAYAIWAIREGLLMDGTGIDDLDSKISRLEMGVILAKIGLRNNLVASTVKETIEFSDISTLSEEEQIYINYIVSIGLINGYADGTFKPENNMTRAEVSAVIYRFIGK